MQTEIRKTASKVKPGSPGPAGPPGERGPEGALGKLPIAKRYEPDRVYYEGDCVVHDGSLYQATRDTGRAVSHSDWICIAKAGRDGKDGRTPVVRGTYDARESYTRLDIIASDGAAFIATRDNPGIVGVGDGWQMISRQGRPGRRGEIGERGPRGEQGPPAEVPQLIGSRISEAYELVLVYSDNSKQIVPLRPAFERFYHEAGLNQVEG